MFFADEHHAEQEQAGEDDHQDVRRGTAAERQRADDGAKAQDPENIEDIRAHDVADGDVGLFFVGGYGRGGELRQRCADGHDREANERLADAEKSGNFHCPIHDPFAAQCQSGQTEGDEQAGLGVSELFDVEVRGFAADFGDAECVIQKDDEKRQQDDAVYPGQARKAAAVDESVVGHDAKQDRRQQTKRDLLPDSIFLRGQRIDYGGYAQDKQDVRDVTAQDVADGDVGVALGAGEQVDDQFRRRRPESDYSQADDDGRDLEFFGDRGGAVDQQVGSFDEQDEAEDEKDVGKHVGWDDADILDGKGQKWKGLDI